MKMRDGESFLASGYFIGVMFGEGQANPNQRGHVLPLLSDIVKQTQTVPLG